MGAAGRVALEAQAVSHVRQERLAALTRLRVLLIGWVVIYHLELALHALWGVPELRRIAMKGYLGVDGFFVLSGFALYLGYRHRPPRGLGGWADFVGRRAVRIFPLHLAALGLLVLLVVGASVAGLRVNAPERFGAWELLMQLPLLNAWETTQHHAWNYPSWALSAIWAGYLVFPILLAVLLGLNRAMCWLIVAAGVAGLAWLAQLPDGAELNRSLHLGLVRFAFEFVLGLALARLVTQQAIGKRIASFAVVLLPLGVVLSMDALAVAGLAALVARLGMEAPGEAAPRDLAWRLGEASFGVYLCWVFVEAGLVLLLRATDAGGALRLVMMAGGFVATMGLGWLAWRWVERPAGRLLEARLRRGSPRPSLGGATGPGPAATANDRRG